MTAKIFTLDLEGVKKSQDKLIAVASKSENEQQFESALRLILQFNRSLYQ